MVTRAGVAKRLGLSIASVRRMEGSELHPWTDERGVHHFDGDEVEEVARATREARGENEAAPFADAERSAARHRLQRLESELATARETARTASERAAQLERQSQELRTTAVEALELVSIFLGGDMPYGVRQTLRELKRGQ